VGLAYDYARVAAIALVSFAIAVFLGYYLATHRRAEAVGVPLTLALAALPAPAYFPLLFLATSAALYRAFGGLTNELYVVPQEAPQGAPAGHLALHSHGAHLNDRQRLGRPHDRGVLAPDSRRQDP